MSYNRIDFDGQWKRIISSTFEDFLTFFAPDLAEMVDWSVKPEDLNRELQKLYPNAEAKNRKADNLYRVYLKDKREIRILVHLEVQGWEDSEFDKRMFQYFYRILDYYGENIYALAIYTNDKEDYMPNAYIYDFFGTKLKYEFNTYKIKDQIEAELIKSPNPFSYVVLVAKKAWQVKAKDEQTKYDIKKQMLRILAERREMDELDIKYVAALLFFMDNSIKLSNELQTKFKQEEINNWEGGIMLSYEEELKNQGKIEGKNEGRNEGKNQAIRVIRLLMENKTIEEISKELNLPSNEVMEIRDKFYQ
ncbi:hypothetical protein HPT25_27410 [Bacillus sp. BRMEA1]|uniref:hypothetical protein n=1 Tax=Neobacillus endophyticus TaxID=2738405 RepID=UPI0015630030|nr:hypothetical protein [Neobacillus endophyticus]NRD81050.1 hypothetical protein [Neobacillus endophyticus]